MMSTKPTRPSVRSLFLAIGIGLLLSACSSSTVVSSHDLVTTPDRPPQVVYVADFDLGADDIKSEGLLHRLPQLFSGTQSKARHLVDLMGDDLVEDLAKKGIEAHRLPAGGTLPKQGWLVRGAFLQIDEGNRLRRAVIGFGAGHTDLQVASAIDDLSADKAPAPLYELQTDARSGKMPGAVVTLNPYAAAMKFALAGRDLDRDIKSSAAKIGDAVVARVNAAAS